MHCEWKLNIALEIFCNFALEIYCKTFHKKQTKLFQVITRH